MSSGKNLQALFNNDNSVIRVDSSGKSLKSIQLIVKSKNPKGPTSILRHDGKTVTEDNYSIWCTMPHIEFIKLPSPLKSADGTLWEYKRDRDDVYFLAKSPITIDKNTPLSLDLGMVKFVHEEKTSSEEIAYALKGEASDDNQEADIINYSKIELGSPLSLSPIVHGQLKNSSEDNNISIYLINFSNTPLILNEKSQIKASYYIDKNENNFIAKPDALSHEVQAGTISIPLLAPSPTVQARYRAAIPEAAAPPANIDVHTDSFSLASGVDPVSVGRNQHLKINLSNFKTNLSERIGNLYLEFTNVEGYDNANMIVPIKIVNTDILILKPEDTNEQLNRSSSDNQKLQIESFRLSLANKGPKSIPITKNQSKLVIHYDQGKDDTTDISQFSIRVNNHTDVFKAEAKIGNKFIFKAVNDFSFDISTNIDIYTSNFKTNQPYLDNFLNFYIELRGVPKHKDAVVTIPIGIEKKPHLSSILSNSIYKGTNNKTSLFLRNTGSVPIRFSNQTTFTISHPYQTQSGLVNLTKNDIRLIYGTQNLSPTVTQDQAFQFQLTQDFGLGPNQHIEFKISNISTDLNTGWLPFTVGIKNIKSHQDTDLILDLEVLESPTPVGTITMWHGLASSIPKGWIICDGFNSTPDLRGRFVVGAHGPKATPSNPTKPKVLSQYNVGDTDGLETVTLSTAQMPSHSHSMEYGGAHQHKFQGWNSCSGSGKEVRSRYQNGNDSEDSVTKNDGSHRHEIKDAGGNESHENRPPYYALFFIMKQ